MFVSQIDWRDRDERPWTIRGFWSIDHALEGPLVLESADRRHVINADLTLGTDEEIQALLDEAHINAWPAVSRTPVTARPAMARV